EDGIRDFHVTGVQTCALPIWVRRRYEGHAVPLGEHHVARHVRQERMQELDTDCGPIPWARHPKATRLLMLSTPSGLGKVSANRPDRKSVVEGKMQAQTRQRSE